MSRELLLLLGISLVFGREIFELTLDNYSEIKNNYKPLLVLFHNDDR